VVAYRSLLLRVLLFYHFLHKLCSTAIHLDALCPLEHHSLQAKRLVLGFIAMAIATSSLE